MLLLKKINCLFVIIALPCVFNILPRSLQAERANFEIIQEPKYKISVCAIFKNEERDLKEWIEYHKLIGIEHFYLYNNDSKDRSLTILAPYVKNGLVTLIHWPNRTPFVSNDDEALSHWALSTQLPAYEHAMKWRAAKETEWLLFLDIDEFLVPVRSHSLSDILEHYHSSPGIEISCDYFEASHIDVLPKRELLITAIELTSKPIQNIQASAVKMMIKSKHRAHFSWPPYQCHFKNGQVPVMISKSELRINKYVNRHASLKFDKRKEKLQIDNRILSERETRDLLDLEYEIDDKEQVIFRFIPELRQRMGLEARWDW